MLDSKIPQLSQRYFLVRIFSLERLCTAMTPFLNATEKGCTSTLRNGSYIWTEPQPNCGKFGVCVRWKFDPKPHAESPSFEGKNPPLAQPTQDDS